MGHSVVVLPHDVEQVLAEMYPSTVANDARDALDPEPGPRVLRAILLPSEGDLDRLRHFAAVAAVDSGVVLYWAEEPRTSDEPSSYEELRARLTLPGDKVGS